MTQQVLAGGRYQLLGLIGEGGMANVYCALDTTTGARVAVKRLREVFAQDPALVARFRHEATAAAALHHPNVVRVLAVGEEEGRPFLVLELVEGPDLRSRLRQEGPFPLPLVLTLGEQLCAALGAAHAQGIVHRDVKPQNVLLSTASDGTVLARLTDFGIARALGASSQTRTGEVLGSVHYLSPEQLRGQPATARSDLYALGCLLYELLTGRVPFEAESDIAVAMRQLQDTPLPPSHWRPGIPSGLDAIVLRCLEKDPSHRFASAADLANALRRYATLTERSTGRMEIPPGSLMNRTVERVPAPTTVPPQRRGRSVAATLVNLVLLAGLGVLLLAIVASAFVAASTLTPQLGLGRIVGISRTAGTPSTPAAQSTRAPATPTARPASTPTVQATTPSATPVPRIEVPVLASLTADEARRLLEQHGLKYREGEARSDDEVPAGRVIAQSPVPTTEVAAGSEVTVILSRGPSRVQVTSVVGLPLDRATEQLARLGFSVVASDDSSTSTPAGTVVGQEPKAGEFVPRGTRIRLLVATGRELVRVPNVVGISEEQAKRQILSTGKLKLFPYVNYQGREQLPDAVRQRVPVGAVLSTTPAGGSEVPPGTEIKIAVRKE